MITVTGGSKRPCTQYTEHAVQQSVGSSYRLDSQCCTVHTQIQFTEHTVQQSVGPTCRSAH